MEAMQDGPEETTAAPVPRRATQAAEERVAAEAAVRRVRWAWAEPTVWTDRMLTALEDGVKGDVWFSLIDKVFSPGNLLASWEQVATNHGSAGVDQVTVETFEARVETNLTKLSAELKAGTYHPAAIRRHYVPKAGGKQLRPLGI